MKSMHVVAALLSMDLGLATGLLIAGEAPPAAEGPPSAVGAKGESEEAESPFSGGFELAVKNKNVWRGNLETDDGVVQPSVYASAYGFTAEFWGNYDLTDYGDEAGYGDHEGQFSEMDFYFSYGLELGPVGLEVGTMSYNFPNRLVERMSEVYGQVSLDIPLHPFTTICYDYREVYGTYFEVGLQEGFAIMSSGDFRLGLAARAVAGFGTSGYNEDYFGVHEGAANDIRLTVSLPVWLNEYVKIAAIVEYAGLLDDKIRGAVPHPDNFIFGGSIGVDF